MARAHKVVSLVIFLWGTLFLAAAQEVASGKTPEVATRGPAETLYLKLRSVGLDRAKVYRVREASLERSKLHISLDDGTIAFTEAVDGHITGAFFVGYGEVLVIPPNKMERASVALFTGSAILEETFSSAYFRFNDDVLAELQPYLRPAEDPAAFVAQWGTTVRSLGEGDALRLLFSLVDAPQSAQNDFGGHLLHAYIHGNKLGTFDARYDSLLQEQVEVGQHKQLNGEDYYDVWASFAVPVPGSSSDSTARQAEADETTNTALDVSSYKIQAHIKPVKDLEARATLNISALQNTGRVLLFELSRMLRLNAVLADGHPVEFIHNQAVEGSHLAKKGNDIVAVVLPSPLQKGQKLELTFDYAGSVLSEAANGLLYVGDRGTWYPNLGFAMASFRLEFHYPAAWTLVATGHRADSKVAGSEQTSTWVTTRPVPVAGFNLGKYSQTISQAGKVEINTYATPNVERGFPGVVSLADSIPPLLPTPPIGPQPRVTRALPITPPAPSPSSNTQMVGGTSAHALEFYERYFGPYPYGELAITQMPGRVSQGWPGLIFLSSYAFLTPEEKGKVQPNAVQRLLSDQVIAHETAHQWWGDLVNWYSYRDQWIMEGLANYSALMLLEEHDPAKFRLAMQAYHDELIGKTEKGRPLMDAGPVTLGFRLSSSEFPSGYESVCYGRGTWLFHMLRTMMRDGQEKAGSKKPLALENEPFVRALQKLRKNYEDKAITTSDLMHVFESELPESLWYEGHKSLDWFYDAWVNGSAIPSIEIKDLKFADKGKTTTVTGTLVQHDATDTLVTAIPLYASIGGKEVFIKRVFAEGEETLFRISAPAGTRKVVVDPEHTLLTRTK